MENARKRQTDLRVLNQAFLDCGKKKGRKIRIFLDPFFPVPTIVGVETDLAWLPYDDSIPGESDVFVWKTYLKERSDLDACLSILNAEEKEIAFRLENKNDQENYIRLHACVRSLLGHITGIKKDELVLLRSGNGKPFLSINEQPSPLRFSVSRSQDIALVSVSHCAETGVDIELVRSFDEVLDLASQSFRREQFEYLSALPLKERVDAFFVFWTRFEAGLKAVGAGLLDVSVLPGPESEKWRVVDLQPEPGYRGALVCEQGKRISLFDLRKHVF